MAKPAVTGVPEGPSPHPESDTSGTPTLQVEAVWPIPVAVDNVHPAVTIEVSQRHTTSMLIGVIQPWGATRGWGKMGQPPCLRLPVTGCDLWSPDRLFPCRAASLCR